MTVFHGTNQKLKDIPKGDDPTGLYVLRATDKVVGQVIQAWGCGDEERVVIKWSDNKYKPRDFLLRKIPLEVAVRQVD